MGLFLKATRTAKNVSNNAVASFASSTNLVMLSKSTPNNEAKRANYQISLWWTQVSLAVLSIPLQLGQITSLTLLAQ